MAVPASGVELLTAYMSLVVSGDNIGPSAQQALGPVQGIATTAGQNAGSGFGNTFNTAAIAAIGVVVAQKAIGQISGTIESASDLKEAGTAVGAVFGTAYEDIDKWATGADQALGQSKLAALDAAKTFGVFGKIAGFDDNQNAEFSKELTVLAGDLASFYNVDPGEAATALGSALRGEAEPMRKYGVMLDDVALKAAATELGIWNGTGSLTAQQKVLAAHSVIMKNTTLAQGDFIATSDGMANQQRIVAAQVENLSARFGNALLPAVEKILSVITPLLEWLLTTPGAVEIVSIVIGTVLVAAFSAWAVSIMAANAALLANPAVWVIAAIIGALSGLGAWLYWASDGFTNWGEASKHAVNGVIHGINALIHVLNGYLRLMEYMLSLGGLLGDWGWGEVGTVGLIESLQAGKTSDVPGLASGGQITRAGDTLVGENGPEILRLGTGSKVIPLDHPSAQGGGASVHLTINNPLAEPTSTTTTRASQLIGANL